MTGHRKELRRIHNLTQEEFSERDGISYKYYQAVESGVKKDLRLSTLERLAKAYGIDDCLVQKLIMSLYLLTFIKVGAGGGTRPNFPAVAPQICLILLAIQAKTVLSDYIVFNLFGVRFGVRLPTSDLFGWASVGHALQPVRGELIICALARQLGSKWKR
jgi:transcriptional regulator with XRE-family HTH domain